MLRTCIDRRRMLPSHVSEAAAQKMTVWEPGRTLRIEFAFGRLSDREAVLRAARVWEKAANIHFQQVHNAPSELRCSFVPGGSWSYVGKEALAIDQAEATMNMGWQDDPARDLHELGHALGLIHEHQSPSAMIPWNKPLAYAFYGGPPNQWTHAEVDEQVFGRYDAATITNTEWDGSSIMEYPIPGEILTDARFAVGWNQYLSATDKAFIGTLYPRNL